MSMAYIRKTYGLTVKCGDRVEYTGGTAPQAGIVTGASGAHLMVRLDDRRDSAPFHPTWELKVLPRATGEAPQ